MLQGSDARRLQGRLRGQRVRERPALAPSLPGTLNTIVYVDGKALLEPFPSRAWNEAHNPQALQSVLGFGIDENDVLWALDQGRICDDDCVDGDQKIVIWDLRKDELIDSITITSDISDYHASFLNDICVDHENGCAYIAVLSDHTGWYPVESLQNLHRMAAREAARVLQGMEPESWVNRW